MLDWDCRNFLDQLFVADIDALNTYILICIFWRLLEAFISASSTEVFLVGGAIHFSCFLLLLCWSSCIIISFFFFQDDSEKVINRVQDFFIFVAVSSLKNAFKKHLQELVEKHLHDFLTKCKISPVRFLSSFFTGEGAFLFWFSYFIYFFFFNFKG